MLKISESKLAKRTLTLRLEGQVVGPWAGELLKVTDVLLADEAKLALDLAEVTFADENGLAVLAGLGRRGVKVIRQSPFVAEQLRATMATNANSHPRFPPREQSPKREPAASAAFKSRRSH